MCCEISMSGKQSSPKLLLLSLQEEANYSKNFGPTDTNCSQPHSLPHGCKFVKSPSDGVRANFYVLVETSSQHRALSWSLIPATPRLSRAMLCASATLQMARGQGRGKPRGQHKYCSKEKKAELDIFFPPHTSMPWAALQQLHSRQRRQDPNIGSRMLFSLGLPLLNRTGLAKPSANAPLGQPAHPALLQKPALPSLLAYKGGCIITAF